MSNEAMIEAVARAICEAAWADVGEGWNDASDEQCADCRRMARAAINAAAPLILDMAASEVIGYVHPAFEKLPGEAFASAKIAVLKERFGRD